MTDETDTEHDTPDTPEPVDLTPEQEKHLDALKLPTGDHAIDLTLLPVPSDHERLLELGAESAKLEMQIEDLEGQKRETAKGFKKRIDGKRERVREIAATVEAGAEEAMVPTVSVKLFESNEMVTYRLDTGEEHARRTLTRDELQMDLDQAS